MIYFGSIIGVLFVAGCASVEFEQAPYEPRNITIVYSAQEDITFVAWQLDETADSGAVTIDLADESGTMRRVDLGAAPFPAGPWHCDHSTCFQFQIAGRFVPPADLPLIRVVHPRFGEFLSGPGALVDVSETFSVDPIALDRNTRADPRRFDYFADEGIPFRRSYDWRLVEGPCGTAAPSALAPMDGVVDLPAGWATPACFEAAPHRADAPGVLVRAPLVPSAETTLARRQHYDAPAVVHTTLFGVLFDLAIADSARCAQVRDTIGARIARAIEAHDPDAILLGTFEPDGTTDCAASTPSSYPIARMLATAQDAVLATTGATTVLWILVSNRTDPNPAFDDAWAALASESQALSPYPAYAWWIASPGRIPSDPSVAWVTPYRAIEDMTLGEDIDTVAGLAAPFRTLHHDPSTLVPLELGGLPRPQYGRICQAIPQLASLQIDGAPVDATFAWPPRDTPLYTVDLGTQIGVPNELFVPRSSDVLFEICTRFCDGPFRGMDGRDHASWLDAGECAGAP